MVVLTAVALLLGIGVCAQWLAWRLHLPSILLLLAAGFAAGPDRLDLVDPAFLLGEHLLPLVGLAVGLILFEGGLSLRFSEIKDHAGVVWRLVTLGALITWVLAGLFAAWILDLPAGLATLLGAVLIVSGPTVVLPLLRHVRPHGPVAPILKWEGIVIDPIGALMALLVYEGMHAGGLGAAAPEALLGIGRTILFGGVAGVLGAWFLYEALKRYLVPDQLHVPLTIAIVAAAFTGANAFQEESGLLAVTLMGVVLANQRSVSVAHILEFKENLRTLLISSLFILLAARVTNEQLATIDIRAAFFVLALIFIVRPAGVWACTLRSDLSLKEKIFLAWLCPRGIVAAAVASVFSLGLVNEGVVGGERLVPLTFLVIIGTVVVYGLTAAPLARRLGISVANPQGVMFVGAQRWVRELAQVMQENGVQVMLADTNRANVKAARMAGLPAWFGNVLHEDALDELELAGIGRLIALTPNDEVNELVLQHYQHEFGTDALYRLPGRKRVPGQAEGNEAERWRVLLGGAIEQSAIASKVAAGWRFKATRLTEQFGLSALHENHGGEALVLLWLENDRVRIATGEEGKQPAAGSLVFALVPPAPDAPESA